MLDDPKKTDHLTADLRTAMPFKVELTLWLINHLRVEKADIYDDSDYVVQDLSYAGDDGGIVCYLATAGAGAALVVSLTHIVVPRSQPFATAVRRYQKHRIKKLKKQNQQ